MLGLPCNAACWDATGSMLQGWGALAAVGAVIYAAANAFGAYRQQKLEDRRIDAAERILTFAYRLEDDLSAVISQHVSASELRRAADTLGQSGLTLGVLGKDAFLEACKAQAVLSRLLEREKGWTDFANIRVIARAHFDADVETCLNQLWSRREHIVASAAPYIDPERVAENPFGIFEVNFLRAGFPVFDARTLLENLLLPIIRSTYSSQPVLQGNWEGRGQPPNMRSSCVKRLSPRSCPRVPNLAGRG